MRSLRRQGMRRFARSRLSSRRSPIALTSRPSKRGWALQIAAQLALDRSALRITGTESGRFAGEASSLLDAFKQGLSGGDGSHDERHSRGDRVLDVLDRAGPLHLAERSVNYNDLVVGNDAGEQNRHRLAILAARRIDRDKSAVANQPTALAGDGDLGSGHDVYARVDGPCRVNGATPRSGPRASTGPRRAPPPCGSADEGGQTPVAGGTRGGVRGDGESPCRKQAKGAGAITGREGRAGFVYTRCGTANKVEPTQAIGEPGRAENPTGWRVSQGGNLSMASAEDGGGR